MQVSRGLHPEGPMVDHVHMLLAIPRRYPVASVVSYIKGKSAMHIARTFGPGFRGLDWQVSLRWQIPDLIRTSECREEIPMS
jgi:REP element-mobilizing transposase RayT